MQAMSEPSGEALSVFWDSKDERSEDDQNSGDVPILSISREG